MNLDSAIYHLCLSPAQQCNGIPLDARTSELKRLFDEGLLYVIDLPKSAIIALLDTANNVQDAIAKMADESITKHNVKVVAMDIPSLTIQLERQLTTSMVTTLDPAWLIADNSEEPQLVALIAAGC